MQKSQFNCLEIPTVSTAVCTTIFYLKPEKGQEFIKATALVLQKLTSQNQTFKKVESQVGNNSFQKEGY